MSWKRLPTYLANLRLRLMPFNEQQLKAYEETGHVQHIAFKTTPRVGKVSSAHAHHAAKGRTEHEHAFAV